MALAKAGPPAITFLTPKQQQAQALALARQAQLPATQALARQRAQAAADYAAQQTVIGRQQDTANQNARNQAQTTTGFTEALANVLKGIAPATQQAYTNAGTSDAAFGKGFSDGLAHVQAQSQGEASNLLNISGGQAQQAQVNKAIGGTGATDALYGIGGYIPASQMNREGAAFAAAQDQLPATAAGQGLQQIGAIGRANTLTQTDLGNKLLDLSTAHTATSRGLSQGLVDLKAQFPGITAQMLKQIQANETAKSAAQIQAQYLGIAGSKVTGVDANGNVLPGFKQMPDGTIARTSDLNTTTALKDRRTAARAKADAEVKAAKLKADAKVAAAAVAAANAAGKPASPSQQSTIIRNAQGLGEKAVESIATLVYSAVPGSEPQGSKESDADYDARHQAALQEYEHRLRQHYGDALYKVITVIAPQLKILHYTPEQVKDVARRIVAAHITPPSN